MSTTRLEHVNVNVTDPDRAARLRRRCSLGTCAGSVRPRRGSRSMSDRPTTIALSTAGATASFPGPAVSIMSARSRSCRLEAHSGGRVLKPFGA